VCYQGLKAAQKNASVQFILKLETHDILITLMDDDFSPSGLREEWSLLLHSFLQDDSMKVVLADQVKSLEFTTDKIGALKKELSLKRKKLNQSIEKIKIKIDQVSVVIDNLQLVGSDTNGLLKEIDFLNHEGEKISEEISQLDQKIKKVHELQELASA
jgi:hypothetical protein